MSFQAYLDNIKAKTGKTADDFRELAAQKGLVKPAEIIAWLKADYGLGHGHANAIVAVITQSEKRAASADDQVAAHFAGSKIIWRGAFDALVAQLSLFGEDVKVSPNLTYFNILRGSKKFAILQVSAIDHLDVGIKLKTAPPTARFETAGSWNAMVTHRVRISDPQQIDAELLEWLKKAYEAT